MAKPLEQFEIKTLVDIPVGSLDASFTNASAFMVISVAAITLFLTLGMRQRALVPGRWQSLAELSYQFVAQLVRENVGAEGRQYFPFIFTLFMFILFSNMIGLIPYSFTVTSHIIVTFALALVVFATWRPERVLIGAWLFGGLTILNFAAQGRGISIPSEFLAIIPYIATILVLVLISRDATKIRLNAPASLGKAFHPSE